MKKLARAREYYGRYRERISLRVLIYAGYLLLGMVVVLAVAALFTKSLPLLVGYAAVQIVALGIVFALGLLAKVKERNAVLQILRLHSKMRAVLLEADRGTSSSHPNNSVRSMRSKRK